MVSFTVTVGGVDMTSAVDMTTFTLESGLSDHNDLCTFTIRDATRALAPSGKQDVLVVDQGGMPWFGGKIATVDRVSDVPIRTWTVQAQGYSALALVTLVNKVYQATTDAVIVADLIASYRPEYTLQTTVSNTIDHISFPQTTLADALKSLCDATGMQYYVDPHKVLHYFDPSTVAAQVAFSDTPDGVTSFAYQQSAVKEDASQITNRVTVVGGIYLSQPTAETFIGDGHTTTFTLSERPYSVSEITVNGTAQSFGNLGTDQYGQAPNNYTVLVDNPTQRVLFQTAPAAGVAAVVTFNHQAPVLVRVADLASYNFYGDWFDGKITDQTIQAIGAAAAAAQAQLARHAYSQLIATFQTRYKNWLHAGLGVTFAKAVDNVSGTFVLSRTRLFYEGNGVIRWEIEATGGANAIPEPQASLAQVILDLVQGQRSTPNTTQGNLDDYTGPPPEALTSADAVATVTKSEPYTWGGASSVYGYAEYKLYLAQMPADSMTSGDSIAAVTKSGPYRYGDGSAAWGYAEYQTPDPPAFGPSLLWLALWHR